MMLKFVTEFIFTPLPQPFSHQKVNALWNIPWASGHPPLSPDSLSSFISVFLSFLHPLHHQDARIWTPSCTLFLLPTSLNLLVKCRIVKCLLVNLKTSCMPIFVVLPVLLNMAGENEQKSIHFIMALWTTLGSLVLVFCMAIVLLIACWFCCQGASPRPMFSFNLAHVCLTLVSGRTVHRGVNWNFLYVSPVCAHFSTSVSLLVPFHF